MQTLSDSTCIIKHPTIGTVRRGRLTSIISYRNNMQCRFKSKKHAQKVNGLGIVQVPEIPFDSISKESPCFVIRG